MFGSSSNNVQSTWGQPTQQPQQTTSAFGQPSAFGSGGAFGQTQQQQPQANPMFGNLGAPSTSTGATGGFGAFANNTTNNSNQSTLFGAPKPATGFGAFGGGTTSTFGGGGAFGSTANNANTSTGTGLFGQPAATNTTSAFGGGGGLFGSKPATTGFGSTTANDTVAPVTTGTSVTPFSAFSEKDGPTSNVTLQYQSITAIPVYRGSSYEELRTQDYQQGRKTAGGFGQPSAFGATPAQPSTSTGLFGQPAQQPATNSIFGGGSAFGATQPAAPSTGFGAFSQPAPQNNNTATGTGIFGSFGQQPQQQQQTNAFGQPQQPAATTTGTGLFGNSAFGQNNQAKPAGFGAFGNTGTTGGTFGTGGAFGTNTTQQQQPATGLFGQPVPTTGAFGALGNTNAPKPSIFGQPAQPAAQAGGIFGQATQQQPATTGFGSGGGLFGNTNNQQPNQQPSGGLFGNTTTQPATGGIFGGGGGLFGNTNTNNNQQQQNQQQPAQTGFGLFGAPKPATAPATGGLFGNSAFGQSTNNNTNTIGQGLFGNTLGQSTAQPATGGTFGNLFNKPAANGMGQSQSMGQSGGLGNSIFGNSTNANSTMTQGSLTASIAQPIGANLPIFSMLPPGPRAVNLDQQPKKKVGFFVDVPTRSPVPKLQLGYTPATTKLRGFASEQGMSSSLAFSTGKPNALSMSKTDRSGSVGPDGFLGRSSSPALGSGGRQSVKKLILDKKVEPSDLFARSGSPGLRGSPGKVTFNPAMSQAAREKDVTRETSNVLSSPSLNRSHGLPAPAPRPAHPHNHFSAHSTNHIIDPKGQHGRAQTEEPAEDELQEGDYWVKPDLKILCNAPYTELSSYEGIVVGRVGYGEIQFLEPVDLTGLTKLEQLKGHVVRFDDKECTVYPDSDDADKPSPGTGLNVRARIVLVRCWAVDKATREPIKDEKHPAAVKHLKRLKGMRDTQFESFDLAEGKWAFTVEHF